MLARSLSTAHALPLSLTVRSQIFERRAIAQADVTVDNQFDRAGHAI